MQRIPPDILPTVLFLCSLLCTDASYSRGSETGVVLRSNMLALSEIKFQAVCNHLSAVLYVHGHGDSFDSTQFGDINRPFQHIAPSAIIGLSFDIRRRLGGSIYFYHKSFWDFLIDPTRSGTFCVTSPPAADAYYKHCLSVVLKYEESYSLRGSGEV
ncbi:hypothetical protein P691DRAFT_769763 [Macrolepiota fuliginosa MF-IS2]|uniref:Uncharacterized protein n=1 Tax=Macrolepiota fuliginosa MF-IS2 TaxID=1400762 RepID=A0A9P5WWG0_9AGAR|nr:hypothetical protein P691DRAFT_769763 [Macrolepiota fuliginosa MF-IS2]